MSSSRIALRSSFFLFAAVISCGGTGTTPSDGTGAGGTDVSTGGSTGLGGTTGKGGGAPTGGTTSGTGGSAAGSAGTNAATGGNAAGGKAAGGAAGTGATAGGGSGASASGGKGAGAAGGANGGNGGNGGDAFGAGGSTMNGGASGSAGGPPGMTKIYAHTNTELYSLDPLSPSLALTKLGAFDCIGGTGQDKSMTDIAVNQMDELWAISGNNVYQLTVTGGAAHCASTIPLKNAKGVTFYGLTFAPVGVLGATEVLVGGNTAGELWQIDANGTLTLRGTMGVVPADDGHGHAYPAKNVGKAWELSGDIVFLYNAGDPVGFATVRDCPTPPSSAGCSKTDTLLQLDLTKLAANTPGSVALAVRGQIVKGATCKDATNGAYGGMYGIAAWDKTVYGFSHTGDLVAIDTADGSGCLVQNYPMDLFAGAGVTTLAPVHKPLVGRQGRTLPWKRAVISRSPPLRFDQRDARRRSRIRSRGRSNIPPRSGGYPR